MRHAIIVDGSETPGKLFDVDGTLYHLSDGGTWDGLAIPMVQDGVRMTSAELAQSIATGLGNGTVAEGLTVILPEDTTVVL